MKRNKYRALVTLDPTWLASGGRDRLGESSRMVVRARHHETHCGKVFSAVVTPDDDVPRQQGDPHAVVTVLVADDDVADYLGTGDHFDLWLGGTVGHGIVTRQIIPCW